MAQATKSKLRPGTVELPQEFGNRVRAIRQELGLSILELAKRAGMSHVDIIRIEQGRRGGMFVRTLAKLSRALGRNIEALLGRAIPKNLFARETATAPAHVAPHAPSNARRTAPKSTTFRVAQQATGGSWTMQYQNGSFNVQISGNPATTRTAISAVKAALETIGR